MTFLIIVIPLSVLAHLDTVTVSLWLRKMWKTTQCSPAASDVETTASVTWPGCCWLQLLLTFLKGVTLYLVMGDGESLHERSDWADQVDAVIHNLYQLFGVGALAPRGLPSFIGGLCGDHSPHRTTMTQTKCCPIFAFWVVVVCLSNGSSRSHRALEGSSLPESFRTGGVVAHSS